MDCTIYIYSWKNLILIGADIAGKLLTGKIRKLKYSLACVDFYLGWTVTGKVPTELENNTDNLFTFSMHIWDDKIDELWNLDTFIILDPFKNETKKFTLQHFLSTVKRYNEGRFLKSVHLA